MSHTCRMSTDGFGFPPEEIADAIERRGLLSMEIEFSRTCNFRCPYCYNDEAGEENPLTSDEIEDVILQARGLGARKIIILGGEPMIYPGVREKIRFIREHDMSVEMFTNGTNMTPENARFMYEHDVAVVVKMNSFKPELQDKLTGHEGSHETTREAIANLEAAGYPAPGKRLAISTIICRPNIDELPELWRWARRKGIEPYFEMLTPQGRALENEWLPTSVSRQKELFEELCRIDREEFDREWEPQPPLVGNTCLRHQFSCFVTSDGRVMPCVGVLISLGNVRETSLAKILDESEVMENLRDYPANIKEPCASCDRADGCYGCRGTAYQLTGDYLAADPTCWCNQGKEIECLPADVASYLPHRPPMLMVDELVSVGERRGTVRAVLEPDHPLVDAAGQFDETAHVELVAQSIAVINGFHQTPEERKSHRGFLMSARDFEVSGDARAGDRVEVTIKKLTKFGDFGVVHGSVRRGEEEIAQGQITVWQSQQGEESP